MEALTGRTGTLQNREEVKRGPFSPEEAQKLFDETARTYLGMSGDEFLRRWDNGDFGEIDSRPQAMRVASLIPLVRKTSAGQKPF